MDYYIFNKQIRNIEKVEIEKEFSDTYVLKDKSGLYSKDLVFDNKFDLYIELLKERINHNILHFSNDQNENNKEIHKMFGYIFSLPNILDNIDKINDNFFHQLKVYGNGLKAYDHLYLEKYFIIYYTSLWEFKNYILKDKSEEYDYKTLERLNVNLNYSDCLLDPNLKKCYGPIINYKELFKLTDINIPLYYAKYDYYVNGALELKYSNPSPFGIDDQLYQKQFSKTMEDDSLVSNFGIEFNHQPIESRFFS